MRNRITSIVITVVMILGCMVTAFYTDIKKVSAEPYNIEISVETKEISLDEIPENRKVPLEVYVSNTPNEDFYIFNIAFKLDAKLDNWLAYCWVKNAISSLSVSIGVEHKTLIVESDTVIHSNKKIENGRIYDILVHIPPEVNEGDFYEVMPVSDCENGRDCTSFVLLSNIEEVYGPSNFSYHGGGIKICSSHSESLLSSDPVQPVDSNISNQQSEISDSQPQIISNHEETESFTSTEITSSKIATSKVTTISNPSEETITITSVDEETEQLNTTVDIEEKEDDNTNKVFFIFIIILLIAAIALTAIIRKRKKK